MSHGPPEFVRDPGPLKIHGHNNAATDARTGDGHHSTARAAIVARATDHITRKCDVVTYRKFDHRIPFDYCYRADYPRMAAATAMH